MALRSKQQFGQVRACEPGRTRLPRLRVKAIGMTATVEVAEKQHEHVQQEQKVPRLTVLPLRHTKVR